jgi:hypothetical protein
MADSISVLSQPLMGQRAKTLTHLVTLRLITGYTLLTVSLIGLFGANWDIQWHAIIGRDRTFTPPHDMILIGIGLNGILALTSILIETWWARRNHELTANSTDFLGILHSSVGSYFVGFGAVCSAVAFPLDTYWHSLYGIDVSLWAPFHTMIYMGGILSMTGITYILLSTAHLAQGLHRPRSMQLGYAGVIVALALLLSRLTTFIIPSLDLSPGGINLFPVLLCLCVAFVCTLVVRVVPWPGTATFAIIVFLVAYFIIGALVPPMMTWLMQVEHQTFLPDTVSLRSIVVPLLGQSPWLLLTGLSIDGTLLLGRRAHWSPSMRNWGIALAAAVSTTIVAVLKLITLASAAPDGHTTSGGHSILPFLLALVIAVLGGLLGSWFGSTISKTVETLRR